MKDRARVAFVIPSLQGGGAERVLTVLLRHLDRTRFNPVVVTFVGTNDYAPEFPKDIDVVCLEKRNRWDFLRLCRETAKLVRTQRCDLLVSFLTYANWAAVIAGHLARKKTRVVITVHNRYRHIISWPRQRLVRLLYPRARSVIAVSQGVRGELIAYFGVQPERCCTIYNPIEEERVREMAAAPVGPEFPQGGHPVIVSCGRLAPQKNFPLLLQAFARIRQRHPASLVILGEGPDRRQLEALAADLGIKDHVRFMGFQENPFKYIARATVFTLCSNFEGFGCVIPEAMACGVPAVVSDCPFGPNEIVAHNVNGLLFPPQDCGALTDALLRVLEDAGLRQKLVAGAVQGIQRFDARRIAGEYATIFRSVLEDRQA